MPVFLRNIFATLFFRVSPYRYFFQKAKANVKLNHKVINKYKHNLKIKLK